MKVKKLNPKSFGFALIQFFFATTLVYLFFFELLSHLSNIKPKYRQTHNTSLTIINSMFEMVKRRVDFNGRSGVKNPCRSQKAKRGYR